MSKAGRKPYGDCKYERQIIEKILELWRMRPHGVKFGYCEIARKINKLGYRSRTDKPFYDNMVRRLIERESQVSELKDQKKKQRQRKQLEAKDYLTPEEVALCRGVLRESDRLLFEVLLGAGLRAGELCELDVRDLGIYHGQSQIDVQCGKGSRNRSVKIGPRLRAMLDQELNNQTAQTGRVALFVDPEGKRIRYRTLYDRMVALGKRAGLTKRLHPHILRHTFASGLYHYKKDLEYVRKQLGHASIATTQIYVNVFSESELEQMAGFERLFGGGKEPQNLQVNGESHSQNLMDYEVTM